MEASRRAFLKLLGIGGASVAARPTALFAPTPQLIGVPGQKHFVFDGVAPRLSPEGQAYYLTEATGVISGERGAIVLRNPNGYIYPQRPWTPYCEPVTYQSKAFPDEDPLVSFFMAAENLREKIQVDALSEGYTMVTRVDMPIMAMPHPDKGFYLECQLSQFRVQEWCLENGGKAVSQAGEIPLEPPTTVEMKYLMLVQEELLQMGMLGTPEALREASRKVSRMAKGLNSGPSPLSLWIS